MLMQSLNFEKGQPRFLIILRPRGEKNYDIGRGHDADIRVTDISVSRSHARINFKDG